MPKQRDYEPMTLGNMRQFGMTWLDVSCHGPDCWHRTNIDVSGYGDDVIVAELGRRFRCSRCGSRTIDARPDWQQYAEHHRTIARAVEDRHGALRLHRSDRRPVMILPCAPGAEEWAQQAFEWTVDGCRMAR